MGPQGRRGLARGRARRPTHRPVARAQTYTSVTRAAPRGHVRARTHKKWDPCRAHAWQEGRGQGPGRSGELGRGGHAPPGGRPYFKPASPAF